MYIFYIMCCQETHVLQEVFPPEVRKYLEKLSSLEPIQKGVAQALGKKETVLQPEQTGHTAPKVPLEGTLYQQAAPTWAD